MVNPRGKRSIGKTDPSTQPLDGWPKKIQSDGNGSCMVPVAVPASMLRGGIASNSMAFSQTPTEGPIAASIVLGTIYIYLLYFFNAGKDQNMWKYVEIVWGSMPTEKHLEIGERVQRELK